MTQVHTKATLCQLAIQLSNTIGHFHALMTRWVLLPILWESVQRAHGLPRSHRRGMVAGPPPLSLLCQPPLDTSRAHRALDFLWLLWLPDHL